MKVNKVKRWIVTEKSTNTVVAILSSYTQAELVFKLISENFDAELTAQNVITSIK